MKIDYEYADNLGGTDIKLVSVLVDFEDGRIKSKSIAMKYTEKTSQIAIELEILENVKRAISQIQDDIISENV